MIIGIIAGVVAMVVLIALAGLYAIYRVAFYYNAEGKSPYDYNVTEQIALIKEQLDNGIQALLQEPYTDVETVAHDGIVLRAKYYQYAMDAPLVICMHGYQGDSVRDFSGSFYIYKRMGYNILLVDQRAHGRSQGHTTTFGNKEHLDCLSWVAYAEKSLNAQAIVLTGVSMGGATVINASAKAPQSVKCVIADCPYDTPRNIITTVMSSVLKSKARLLYPIVKCSARLYARCDIDAYSPLSAIPNAVVPVMLIHGDADDFVPPSMSIAIHDVAPAKSSLQLIPNAGHTLSRLVAPELYEQLVRDFIQQYIQ